MKVEVAVLGSPSLKVLNIIMVSLVVSNIELTHKLNSLLSQ